MARALELLDTHTVGALVAAKVDRLARDTEDLLALEKRATRDGWTLVALDIGADTSTPQGRLVLTVLAGVARWERDRIAERTREALAAKKAKGQRLGRPVRTSAKIRDRIRLLRHEGLSMQRIADLFNDEGLTTVTGRPWTWRSVQKQVNSLRLDDQAVA
jgi:DNA invertase Pin-like site-specific DNA recombinase